MDILSHIEIIYSHFINYALIMMRIFALLYTFAVFRKGMATIRIISVLSSVLALYVLFMSPQKAFLSDTISIEFFLLMTVQAMIGFVAGLILNLTFEIFTAAGQIISAEIGLSAASLFDPKFGNITTLTNFYVITATILFLAMNGHLIIIEAIVKSFAVLPVDVLIANFKGNVVFKYASIIFVGGVLVSITIIAAILMTNICLAVMSKFAPQFNLFSVGLSMSLIIGLICVYLTYHIVIDRGEQYIHSGINTYMSYLMSLAAKA